MRARTAVATAVAALAVPSGAGAATTTVTMPGRTFSPAHVEVVRGDTVRWLNGSGEAHDVQAAGGAFDSGPLAPGREYAHTFAEPATVPYFCALHRTQMTGDLDIVAVILRGPAQPLARGEEAVLEGRVPADVGSVRVERSSDGGPFTAVADLRPAPDGTFVHRERPAVATAYRAVSAEGASAPVAVGVVDRIETALRVTFRRSLTTLHVLTRPARPGATAVLELYSPERFAWRQVARGSLDQAGRMTLTLRPGVRRRARVVVLDPGGGRLTASRAVRTYRPRPERARRAGSQRAPGPHQPHARAVRGAARAR